MEEWFIYDFDDISTCGTENICLGNHGCPRWLERKDILSELIRFDDKETALIIPPLKPHYFRLFSCFLESINLQWSGRPLEIVANDWGVFFYSLNFDRENPGKIIPSIGRFLVRIDTDPDIVSFKDGFYHPPRLVKNNDGTSSRLVYSPPKPSLSEHWSTPSLFGRSSVDALKQLSDNNLRMETDIPLHGLSDRHNDAFESIFVTAYADDKILSMLPCRDCSKCSKEEKLLGISRFGVPIYQKNNLIYCRPLKGLFRLPKYIDRLIYSKNC